MKKLTAFLLAILFVLGASGMVKAEDNEADKNAHVFYYNYGDTYISTVRGELDKIWEENGWTFQNYDAAGTQTTQTEQVGTALTNQAPFLIVNLVETGSDDAANGIVEQAMQDDVPLIFFNREVTDEVINSYEKAYFVGTIAAEAGQMQGKMIGEYLVEHFDELDLNGDGEISYVMLKGEEGNPEAEMRTKYGVEDANAILEEAGKPALKFYDEANKNLYLVDQGGNWSATAAQEHMSTLLSQYNEENGNMVELVIANNDGMAEGAISALEAAGYNKAADEDGNIEGTTIPVFGVDATDAAKSLIANGQMTGTIKQDAEGMARTLFEIVQNLLEGKEAFDGMDFTVDEDAAKIRVPYQPFTADDAKAEAEAEAEEAEESEESDEDVEETEDEASEDEETEEEKAE